MGVDLLSLAAILLSSKQTCSVQGSPQPQQVDSGVYASCTDSSSSLSGSMPACWTEKGGFGCTQRELNPILPEMIQQHGGQRAARQPFGGPSREPLTARPTRGQWSTARTQHPPL